MLPFGAGHSVYDDPADFARVQRAFAPYPDVILLLPSADVDEALRITIARFRALVPDVTDDNLKQVTEINRYFIEHPSNARLATRTIYTKDQTAEQTRDDILRALKLDGES